MSEKEYMITYKTITEVNTNECYMGSKNCGTCAHCRTHTASGKELKNDYCTCAKRN